MYNRQETALLKQAFWTSFGQYMAPVPSAEGVKINWVNYKTGIKDLHFKMQADHTTATISIVLTHPDPAQQLFFFDRLTAVKSLLQTALQEDWEWALQVPDENNKIVSAISASLTGVSILKKDNWPAIISFFKPRIMALDTFWSEARFMFEVF